MVCAVYMDYVLIYCVLYYFVVITKYHRYMFYVILIFWNFKRIENLIINHKYSL